MPKNTGTPPNLERVDIRYLGGCVDRNVDPTKRRWTLNDPKYPQDYAFTIESWQAASRK